MTDAVRITSCTIMDRRYDTGDILLAVFDCQVRGFALRDCSLILAKRGVLVAQTPRGEARRTEERAITIVDPELRQAMAGAAHVAYLKLAPERARA